MHIKAVPTVHAPTSLFKRSVNLSLSDALVRESRADCGNPLAKVEDMLQTTVASERQALDAHRQQVRQVVSHWNALHDATGSYADGHSTR